MTAVLDDLELCHCGASLDACQSCGDLRCLDCDPIRSDDCVWQV